MTMHVQQVSGPTAGRLEAAERETAQPGPHHVRLRVEACGICHSDSFTVENHWPGLTFPRIPGHEIAGRIEATGSEVVDWQAGDRAGVGWDGGHCGHCDRCRRGDFITCRYAQVPGIAYDGGYAQTVVVPANALARIPDELSAAEAAPLLCAGLTTFNALRHAGAQPGDLVAVQGLGGLGHLGVQFAAAMGFRTVAIARGKDKEALAHKLGAHHYLDGAADEVAAGLQKLGGAKAVLSTVTAASAMAAVIDGLTVDGRLVIVGASPEPLPVNALSLIGARRSIAGWPSGTAADSEDTMRFCVQTGIRAQTETMPLGRAQEAYDRMMSGAARFRMVLLPES